MKEPPARPARAAPAAPPAEQSAEPPRRADPGPWIFRSAGASASGPPSAGLPSPGDDAPALEREAEAAARASQAGPRPIPISQRAPVAPPAAAAPVPSGEGQRLPSIAGTRMEAHFGPGVRGVRLHAGPEARELARVHDAVAFAWGRHVVLGADAPPPHTAEGSRLLAHEIAHVAQQGALEPGAGRGGRVLRQRPRARRQFQIRSPRVLRYVQARDPLLAGLLRGNRLDGRPTPTGVAQVVNGRTHRWSIAFRWTTVDVTGGGRTAERPLPAGSPTGPVEHVVDVEVDPNVWVNRDDAQLHHDHPDAQDRAEFVVAETVFHELVHASLRMERGLPAGAPRSARATAYESALARASSAALSAQRDPVLQAIRALAAMSGSPMAVQPLFDRTIDEWFTSGETSRAFAHVRSSTAIAMEAAAITAQSLLRSGTRPPASEQVWRDYVQRLQAAFVALYDALGQGGSAAAPPPPATPPARP